VTSSEGPKNCTKTPEKKKKKKWPKGEGQEKAGDKWGMLGESRSLQEKNP